jgi:3(or 17)beta-hydroxysteroid dehydrogenase
MNRVTGKVALVTGGGSGLGAADCEALAREGATVIVTDIKLDTAQAVANRIDGVPIALALDVADEYAWIAVMRAIAEKFGRLDILVNNAGVTLVADVEQTTLEQFRWINSIMCEGVFLGCKHAIPLMHRSDGGSIVNMSSTTVRVGYPGVLAYTAAKGAVSAMTRSIAVMCQEKGYKIRCNTVQAGVIETPMVQAAFGRPGRAEVIPEGVLPPGVNGAPKDVANMILFLVSDEARFVNGAEFVIDNAATIRP